MSSSLLQQLSASLPMCPQVSFCHQRLFLSSPSPGVHPIFLAWGIPPWCLLLTRIPLSIAGCYFVLRVPFCLVWGWGSIILVWFCRTYIGLGLCFVPTRNRSHSIPKFSGYLQVRLQITPLPGSIEEVLLYVGAPEGEPLKGHLPCLSVTTQRPFCATWLV
jgi:hypothetical protein